MIEIVVLLVLARMQSKVVGRRGLAMPWGFLGVAMMFGGEFLGGTLGLAFGLERIQSYALALTIGIIGVTVSFAILEFAPAPRQ